MNLNKQQLVAFKVTGNSYHGPYHLLCPFCSSFHGGGLCLLRLRAVEASPLLRRGPQGARAPAPLHAAQGELAQDLQPRGRAPAPADQVRRGEERGQSTVLRLERPDVSFDRADTRVDFLLANMRFIKTAFITTRPGKYFLLLL